VNARLYPDRPFLAASIAVVRAGKVLLAARTALPNAQVFSLPGGGVEAGETLEAAALRELAEETGVIAEIVGFNGFWEVIDRDEAGRLRRHFVIASFAARWIAGEGEPSVEAPAIVWTDLAEAAALQLTSGLMPLLERACDIVGGSP
jgi:ADP-ribose pyrophosphatase YjhB (NUDIX family)